MDRRLTPFSGRIALASLQGAVGAEGFTEGEAASVSVPLADLLRAPGGARDRQLLLGDMLTVIDTRDDHVFVQAAKDGYCGWLAMAHVGPAVAATHWVAATASHLYRAPKVQAPDIAALSMGARLHVTGTENGFAQTTMGYVPAAHLQPIGQFATDPVTVAKGFLGCAYLWGGNSHAGLDCSGLVQIAMLACGHRFPGDSDLQEKIGTEIAPEATLQRGDLLFWKGHVAMVVDETRLIHANGHSMSVAYETIGACIERIARQGGGPVTARKRPIG